MKELHILVHLYYKKSDTVFCVSSVLNEMRKHGICERCLFEKTKHNF